MPKPKNRIKTVSPPEGDKQKQSNGSPRLVVLPVTTFRPKKSIDTLNVLKELKGDAEAGGLVGIVWGALYSKRGGHTSYQVGAAGEVNNHVTLARGMLRKLDDLLAKEH